MAGCAAAGPDLPLSGHPGRVWTLRLGLTERFFQGSQGSGIPQAIAARQIVVPLRSDVRPAPRLIRPSARSASPCWASWPGAVSFGREGPTVQVGAAIMHEMGRLPGGRRYEGLLLAGGAAAIAAAFNMLIAGIVFAIEELSRFVRAAQ